jgi:hypothetical protein
MATKTVKQLEQEILELRAGKLGFEQMYAQTEDKNSDHGLVLFGQIKQIEESISELEDLLDQAEEKTEKAAKRSAWKKNKPAIDQAINDNYMGYIIPEDKFIYCRDYGAGQSNVQFKMFNSTRIVKALSKLAGVNINHGDHYEIIDYFQQQGKTYLDVTSSFNKAKWNESEIYNKMSVIREKWIKPDFANADAYNRDLDVLIACVCGGKQENIDHLERWVAFKYLNPAKNANIPNLDLGGNPGGNGKGRFVEILKTIFTPACVIQAHREELDKFNGAWEMAVILYYDEPEEKELAASKLKQATGAEDMRVEKKGIDATMADRNYNFIFMSNNKHGVVKLSGGSDGGEDRRYSVINTDLVLMDVLLDSGKSKREAQLWLDDMAQKLVKDPVDLSRWLAHLIRKHAVELIPVLSALHGEDYHARFESQKDAITQAFDEILPVFLKQRCMPLMTLTEIVHAHTENHRWKEHKVGPLWETYLKRNRIEFAGLNRTRYRVMWGADDQLREAQGKLFVVEHSERRDFDVGDIFKKRPNYDAILPNVIGKSDLVIG